METDTRSLMPTTARTAARKARVADCESNALVSGCKAISAYSLTRRNEYAHQAHRFAYYEHQGLICYGGWGGKEEEPQCDMEERERGNYRRSRDKTHFSRC